MTFNIMNSVLSKRFFLFLIIALLFIQQPCEMFYSNGSLLIAATKKNKKTIAKKKSTTKKPVPKHSAKKLSLSKKSGVKKLSKSSAKKKPVSKKKSSRKRKTRAPLLPAYSVIKDTMLTNGVRYKKIILGKGRARHSVHVIETKLDSGCEVKTLKAKQQAFGLEKLYSMAQVYDSVNQQKVIGAVNANFWRAYKNFPIGPTISNGEIVELNTYKRWSSGLFDKSGKLYVDNFYISGNVLQKNGKVLPIQTVNRRRDSTGIVLYNRFGGDIIPFVQPKVIEKALADALQETFINDSTEDEFDIETFKEELENSERTANLEFNIPKITLRYLTSPAINKRIACVVESFRQGAVVVPENGCVLSTGIGIPSYELPKVGDTLFLEYKTNIYSNIEFYEGVSGTPRLVRNGTAKHEAFEEGSRGRRFIRRGLARTAIGTDRSRETLFFAAIEPNNGKTTGATLQQLAELMKSLGAYNAMNLDGGGSTVMVVDDKNVMYPNNPSSGRRISVGLGIVAPKN